MVATAKLMQPIQLGTATALLVLTAVGLELCVSANLLTYIGLPYVTEGGALPLKLHPATDLIFVLSILPFFTVRASYHCRIDPTLRISLGALILTTICAETFTGRDNLIVLVDNFLPAVLLAVALARLPAATIAALRRVIQFCFVANAVLALSEALARTNMIPFTLNDEAYLPRAEDFRPTALYDHPLTGALMTMMALSLPPSPRVPRLVYLALMWAALIAFGGRMAIGVTLLALVLSKAAPIMGLILSRDPVASRSLLLASVGLMLAALALAGGISAGLGDRLATHLYWDASAQIRLAQWDILSYLDTWQFLFGMPRRDLLASLNALRLSSGVGVIENFWLLMFVTLGIGGFATFLLGISALLLWCWRRTESAGRVLLATVIIVASSSNSLGRKSPVLVCLVACVACKPRNVRLDVRSPIYNTAPRRALVA